MLHAKAIPPADKAQVRLAERTVALVDVDEGRPATKFPSAVPAGPGTTHDKDIALPSSYVFDVYRVAGGKRHTYCFHGCPDDEFAVNARSRHKLPLYDRDKHDDDRDVRYLRKFVLDGYQHAGDAPETVVATWRLGREPWTFQARSGRIDEGKTKQFKCSPPEPLMYGRDYDPASPRKFVRLHLLDQAGARLLWGRWVSAPYTSTYGHWFTQLYAMHDGDQDRQSAFAAVIETYAGSPAIASVKSLAVDGNEADALRAVAVEVKTPSGRRDVLVADGRPDRTRKVRLGVDRRMTAAGRYAMVSTDEQGLRQAGIVGGRKLVVPGVVSIQPETAAYAGTIWKIDHLRRTFELDADVPGKLVGRSFWEVGNDGHRTSLEVLKVEPAGSQGGSTVHFRKGLELVCTRVRSADPATGVVVGKLASVQMGLPEDNGLKPGMTDGLWASDERMTKWWRCTYTGGTRTDGYRYQLTGAPVGARDFPVGGAIRIWELGATDRAELATFVSLRRHPLHPGLLELSANVPCTVALPAKGAPDGYEMSFDRLTWKAVDGKRSGPMWSLALSAEALGSGRVLIRPAAR
jgi:hypothetical protein